MNFATALSGIVLASTFAMLAYIQWEMIGKLVIADVKSILSLFNDYPFVLKPKPPVVYPSWAFLDEHPCPKGWDKIEADD